MTHFKKHLNERLGYILFPENKPSITMLSIKTQTNYDNASDNIVIK